MLQSGQTTGSRCGILYLSHILPDILSDMYIDIYSIILYYSGVVSDILNMVNTYKVGKTMPCLPPMTVRPIGDLASASKLASWGNTKAFFCQVFQARSVWYFDPVSLGTLRIYIHI